MTGKMLEVWREIRGAVAECYFFETKENTISLETLEYIKELLIDIDQKEKNGVNGVK